MTADKLKEILQKGEGIEYEFKTSLFELNKDAFESICAFLNRRGGHLLLGVKNDGTVEGVMENCIQNILNNIVTNANNPQKLNPPFYLSTQVIDYKGKKVIHVYVPESSQVHSTNGKIFDRNEDGDFDISRQTEQVTQLYLRKQTTYSENRIYPYIKLSDFKGELFIRVRTLAKNQRSDHPWLDMTDEELLRSAGLYKHDHQTGKNGYTLAAVLLLGEDEVIQSVLPHHKTDSILRVENMDRYDDRDDIRTNLIESYDRLMAFVRKHLPDKFYQEGEQRISVRDRIFREVIGNLLIHREYTNAFPAKLIIEKDRISTENWNRPHDNGVIDPLNFSPYPKNPIIAKFFKEIGRVDELGSGVRNTFRYYSIYTPETNP
ncbi:putative DNA binding domain-containing protein [Fulvivirga kasyanovii]|uniref:AAA family ATPase n=1 Tax=Fulvivirga kasyanovii TaxID=396812 RepID=A0ABW9RTU4_9BACT|nr:RNA-binding domain-containing protein [Fulvivirga kasyanovii]MTI27235.1 AAA family ATPase [Fulvivirga kasyanovii]